MRVKLLRLLLCFAVLAGFPAANAVQPAVLAAPPYRVYLPAVWQSCPGNCYFVSSSTGNDANPGTDSSRPFKTLAKVNSLGLGPRDQVFFKCGDTWRGEVLNVTRSGQTGSPVTYTSYPRGCANQPRIDGTQPVTGWSQQAANLYFADLGAGANAARFKDLSGMNAGINQLFRAGARLTMGRWPNLSDPNFDQGYSAVDSQPAGNRLTDAQLPPNLNGGTIHLKVIRWSMINRDISSQNGTTLTLNTDAGCYGGSCAGWGYFINNHLNTLDSEGEWYYDKSTRRVYLYTSSDPNGAVIEASVNWKAEDRNQGLITLGVDYADPVHDILIDNLELRGSWRNGIASPTNLHPDENRAITLRSNTIRDVDDTGIDLWSWVWGAADGIDGWRGGNQILIENNRIEGANHFGIHTPSRLTTITGNTIREIALIPNLNESGMGCGKTGNEGQCTESGAGLRIYTDKPSRSGYGFQITNNRFEYTGYHGIQTFGSQSTIAANVFNYTCYSKGDCGAINTFGYNNLNSTYVYDIQILDNLILNTIGNSDGAAPSFHSRFGFGIYLDNYSRNITSRGNTVAYSTATGILYQNSNGSIENNTVFQNGQSGGWYYQVTITSSSQSANFANNILVSHNDHLRNLSLVSAAQLAAADYNRYYHTTNANYQVVVGSTNYTLPQWQAFAAGKDGHSSTGSLAFSASVRLYVNDTAAPISIHTASGSFTDLDGASLGTGFILAPFSSRVVSLVP
jgi:parallel beta-helix repeat protein